MAASMLFDDGNPKSNRDCRPRAIIWVSYHGKLDLLKWKMDKRLRPEATDRDKQEHIVE